MRFDEETVLRILALALDNSTPDHHLEYLLKKLYGKDGLSLDNENTKLYLNIVAIADEFK